MLRTKLAKKVLTKKEQKHLSEVNVHSMAAFIRTRAAHAEMREKNERDKNNPLAPEPCFDCRHIALKLGLEQ